MTATHRKIFYSVAQLESPPVTIRYFVEVPGSIKYCKKDLQLADYSDGQDLIKLKSPEFPKHSDVVHFVDEDTVLQGIHKYRNARRIVDIIEALHEDFVAKHPLPNNGLVSEASSSVGLSKQTPAGQIQACSHPLPALMPEYFLPDIAEIECYGQLAHIRVRLRYLDQCWYCISDLEKALNNKKWNNRLTHIFHHLRKKHVKKLYPIELLDASDEEFVDETGLLRAIGTAIDQECNLQIRIPFSHVAYSQIPTEQIEKLEKGNEMSVQNDKPSNPPEATQQKPGQENQESHPSSYSFLHDEPSLNLPKATGESSFEHGGQTFRFFFDEHGDGWFNAADIVHYLGYDNVRSKLEEYDITDSRQFIFRGQKALFLSVKGFEKILTESGSPKAGELWDFFINNETSMEKQQEDMEEKKEEATLEQAFEKGEGFIAEPPSSFRTETSSTAEASDTPSETQTSGEPKEIASASPGKDEGQQPLSSTEEISSNPVEDRIFQVYPGFVPEIEAHEIHRKIKTDLTFDQWLDNQIATYDANEGVDYIRDKESGDVFLSSGMTRKIIDAYTADVIARSQKVLDKDVNNVTFQNKVFRFLYDENHNKWYVIEDIQRYLGEPEVQHAIDTYGNPDDPVTVETDVNEYLCFSEETFKKMLANSQNPEIQAIYEGLFGQEKSLEAPKAQQEEEAKVEEKVEEPETEVPITVREEEFVLTPEPAPSDQSNLDLSTSPSEEREEKVPSEEEKPEALTVEQAISPKIGTFEGKYFWVVDAKDLHTYLEPPKPYPLWIKDLIEFYGYIENTDYSADREKGVYLLSLPMAREIAMSVPSERSKEVRTYLAAFSEAPIPGLETATSNQTEIPSSEQPEVPQSQEESSYISEPAQEIPSEKPVKEGIVAIEEDIVEEREPEESASDSEEEQKSEEQASRKYIRVWTIKGGARELGVGHVFLKAYLEDIGWLFPNTYDPKLYIMRKGLMAYNFGEVTTDAHIGLITEEGLEVLRQKLVRLGIIQFGSPD